MKAWHGAGLSAVERPTSVPELSFRGERGKPKRIALLECIGRADIEDWRRQAAIAYLRRGEAGPLKGFEYAKIAEAPGTRWDQALDVLEELRRRDLQPGSHASCYAAVTTACEKAGTWWTALQMIAGMKLRGIQLTREAEAASGWRLREGAGEAGRRPAEKLGQKMDPQLRNRLLLRLHAKLEPGAVASTVAALRLAGALRPLDYTLVIGAYGRVRLWEAALDVLQEMGDKKFAVQVISYNAALAACEKGGQWQQALALLFGMRGAVVLPDRVSYTTVIGAVARDGHWQVALQLLEAIDRAGGPPADVQAFSAAITACARGMQWRWALALMAGLQERYLAPDEVAYGAAISACERSRQWQSALALLRETAVGEEAEDDVDGGLPPAPAVDFLGFTEEDWKPVERVLRARRQEEWEEEEVEDPEMDARWEEFKRTWHFREAPESPRRKPEGWEEAQVVLQSFGEDSSSGDGGESEVRANVVIYSATISACSKGQQWGLALELLAEMEGRGLEPTAVTLSAIVRACERGQQWQLALHLLSKARQPDVVIFNTAMCACGSASKWRQALQLLPGLRAALLAPTLVTYNSLLGACAEAGEHGIARSLLLEMEAAQLAPDARSYKALRAAAAKAAKATKRSEEA